MGIIKSVISSYFALAAVNTTLYGFNRAPLYKVAYQSGVEEFIGKNAIGAGIDGLYAGRHAEDKPKPKPPFTNCKPASPRP
jgi:hypothetical protein